MIAPAGALPILVPQHYVILVNCLEREFGAVADILAATPASTTEMDDRHAAAAVDCMLETLVETVQCFSAVCNGSLGRAFAGGIHLSDGDLRAVARAACEPALLLARGLVSFQCGRCTGRFAKPARLLASVVREVLCEMLEFEQGLVRLIHFPEEARARIVRGEVEIEYRPKPSAALREFGEWISTESKAAEALQSGAREENSGNPLPTMLLLAALGLWVA